MLQPGRIRFDARQWHLRNSLITCGLLIDSGSRLPSCKTDTARAVLYLSLSCTEEFWERVNLSHCLCSFLCVFLSFFVSLFSFSSVYLIPIFSFVCFSLFLSCFFPFYFFLCLCLYLFKFFLNSLYLPFPSLFFRFCLSFVLSFVSFSLNYFSPSILLNYLSLIHIKVFLFTVYINHIRPNILPYHCATYL